MLRVRRWRDIYRASLKSGSLAFIPLASLLTSSLIQIRLFPGNFTSLTASSRVDALAKDKQRLLQMWRSSHHRPHLQSHSKLWRTHSSPPSIHHSSHFPFHWNSQASETRSSTSPSYPKEIAGLTVTSIVDLTTGYDSTNPPTYKPSLPLSSGHMIQFRAENKQGMKFVLTTRSVIFSLAKPLLFTPLVLSTSGTEPKVYLFISVVDTSRLLSLSLKSWCRSSITLKAVAETSKPFKSCWSGSYKNWETSGLKLTNGVWKDRKWFWNSIAICKGQYYCQLILAFLLASKAFASSQISFETNFSW